MHSMGPNKENQEENHLHNDSACNNHMLYNNILVQNLCCQHNISGCMVCGAELSTLAPLDDRKIIEAYCKGLLGSFYCLIPEGYTEEILPEDLIIVSFEDTTEVATVTEVGELVKIKRQKAGFYGELLPHLLRKAEQADHTIFDKNRSEEEKAREIFKVKVHKYNLNMKLIDIHYQFDRNKLFFFYTADGRVDFRELAKDLAANFRTRIELRQIGVRDEAKRIGGMGTCGREFCCSSFLNNFKKITTQLASEQNLASNFSKLSGPCGKLKCCLSFERDAHQNQENPAPENPA